MASQLTREQKKLIRSLAKRFLKKDDNQNILEDMANRFPPKQKYEDDPWGLFLHSLYTLSPNKATFKRKVAVVNRLLKK